MIPASSKLLADQVALARAAAVQMLAATAGCTPEEVKVTDTRSMTFAHRFEDPQGKHSVTLDLHVAAVTVKQCDPTCEGCQKARELREAANTPPPVPTRPEVPPQADGAG